MTLFIAWQLRDDDGVLSAGSMRIDERFAAVNPTEPAFRVADQVERALIEAEEARQAADLVRIARNRALRTERERVRALEGAR